MTRIATFAVQELALSNVTSALARNQDQQIAISSGKKSRDYAGIATDSRRLINVETIREQALRFTNNIDVADRRLQSMESVTAQAFDMASDLRTLLLTALSGNNAPDMALRQQSEQMLEQVVGLLNTDQDGRYLFAGARTETPPIDINALLNPTTPLVGAVEFTGAATTLGTGVTSTTGIVSVQVPSGNSGNAYQLTYDGVGTLTMTNLADGSSGMAVVAAPPLAGETQAVTIAVGGVNVVVTIDDQFPMATPIATQPITGTVGGGAGAFGAITVNSTLGNITQINSNVIAISSPTNDAANITLTLPSADGNFVATGLDFETATGVQAVTLTNATTGAQIVLSIDVTTQLVDATIGDPGTLINLDNFLVNMAATAGATSSAAARPGEAGYDPTDPSYYNGDATKLSLRADDQVTVKYGVTAIESGFEELVRAIFITLQASQDPNNINTTDLEGALAITNLAIDDIPNTRSEIGTSLSGLERLKGVQDNTVLLAEETIGKLEDTDVAEAITLMAQYTLLIEASYATIGRLTNLSLLQFI